MKPVALSPSFNLAFATFSKTSAPDYSERLLTTWYDRFPMFAPDRMDYYEPVRRSATNVAEALPLWNSGDIVWTRKKTPKGEGSMSDRTNFGYGRISMRFAAQRRHEIEPFFRAIADVGEVDFGYLHLNTDREFHRPMLSGEAARDFMIGALVNYAKDGFPNLGWLTVFSAKQAAFLGLARLRDAGFQVDELESGITFLKLTDSIWDVQDDFPRFDERRTKAKELLGLQHFRPWELHKTIEQMRAEAPPPPFLSPEAIERMRAKAAPASVPTTKETD